MSDDLDISTVFEKVDENPGNVDGMSFSMMVDNGEANRKYDSIQPRTRMRWQEDSSVSKCSCGLQFGYFVGRHHCRLCSKVYCDKCTCRRSTIPEYLTVPTPSKGKEFKPNEQVRVCDACYKKLNQVKPLETLIRVFDLVNLDINDFKSMKLVCKTWNEFCNVYLSKFREIQYVLPNHKYNKFEVNALWVNRKYLVGHSIWFTHLLRSVDYQTQPDKKTEILRLLDKHISESHDGVRNKKHCWELMCTRRCMKRLSSECCLMLLDPECCVGVKEIKRYAIEMLITTGTSQDAMDETKMNNGQIDIDELSCYIQYLVHCESVAQDFIILDSLIQEINKFEVGKGIECDINRRCIRIANEIFWEINIGLQSRSVFLIQVYKTMYDRLRSNISLPFWNVLLKSNNFVERVKDCYNFNDSLEMIKYFSKNTQTVNPVFPEYGDMEINAAQIEMKSSITKPVVIPMFEKSGDSMINTSKTHIIMYKKEDVRKDQIIMSIIKLMDLILKRELGIDLGIITYRIRPTSPNEGFIEIVQQCSTLYKIQQTGMTLLNYILEQNNETTQKTIRNRFIKSCAAYCVITYLLGIGDRHLENIMISNDGRLFHIDYGFVLGQDPKPIKVSHMRISSDMLDALGGVNSKNYDMFKKLCDRIYNTLRVHLNLFACLLNLFSQSKPRIDGSNYFTEHKVMREIHRRFAPGENYQEAKIQLHNQIEDSTTQSMSYKYALIDFFHKHNKEQTIKHTIGKTANATYGVTRTVFSKMWDFVTSSGTLDD